MNISWPFKLNNAVAAGEVWILKGHTLKDKGTKTFFFHLLLKQQHVSSCWVPFSVLNLKHE